jgi:hypothetical protein
VQLLKGDLSSGDQLLIDEQDDKLVFQKMDQEDPDAAK